MFTINVIVIFACQHHSFTWRTASTSYIQIISDGANFVNRVTLLQFWNWLLLCLTCKLLLSLLKLFIWWTYRKCRVGIEHDLSTLMWQRVLSVVVVAMMKDLRHTAPTITAIAENHKVVQCRHVDEEKWISKLSHTPAQEAFGQCLCLGDAMGRDVSVKDAVYSQEKWHPKDKRKTTKDKTSTQIY